MTASPAVFYIYICTYIYVCLKAHTSIFNMSCNCFIQLCKSVSAGVYLVYCSVDFCGYPFFYTWTMTTIEIIFLAWAAWHKNRLLNLWCIAFEKFAVSFHCTHWAPISWDVGILFSFLSIWSEEMYWKKRHLPIYLSLIYIFNCVLL